MSNYSHAMGSHNVAYGQDSYAEGYNNGAFAYRNKNNSYIKPYNIEVLSVSDGDVIILHLNENLSGAEISGIQKEIKQYFPNNQVICANEHILKQITVLHRTDNPFEMELDLGSINLNLEALL